MKRGRIIYSLTVAAAVIPLVLGYHCRAYGAETEENTFVVEMQFETTDKNEDRNDHFPEVQEKDGETYIRKAVVTKIIREETLPAEMITLEGEWFTQDPKDHRPSETIERDGKIYELVEQNLVDTILAERKKQVSTVIPYKAVEYIDTLPETGQMTVADEDTGQTVHAELPYESHREIKSYWDNSFSFPITVVSYDANTYRLGEVKIPKNTDLTLYSREFLEYLGLPEDYYRVINISWEGDIYESNGELRRNALATGQKFVKDMEVTYSGSVNFQQVNAKAYNSVYQRKFMEGEPDTLYIMEVQATYARELPPVISQQESDWKNKVYQMAVYFTAITISLGVVIVILWLTAVLWRRMRRRKRGSL